MTAGGTCASGVDRLMDYLENEVSPEIRADLEGHLAGCPRCAAFVRSYLETPRILRQATLAPPPADFERSLREFLRRRLG